MVEKYTTEHSAAARNDGILQFAAIWMEMEDSRLSEVNQKKRQIQVDLTYLNTVLF